MSALTDQERAVLDFERQWWRVPGAKEQAIHDRFGITPTHYYQILNGLMDRREAVEYDPMLVKRLQRLQAHRQRRRTG